MEVNRLITFPTTLCDISDITQVGEARRTAAELSANLQFDVSTAGEIAIVVNELGTNLVKHGQGGQLLFNPRWSDDGSTLDIVALDKGPGMADLSRCMQDGYSSGGTAGNGLGAVRRLAGVFDIVTTPGKGTGILARMHKRDRFGSKSSVHPGVVNLPIRTESVSGDSWALRVEDNQYYLMIADGLGHGHAASVAARAAIRIFSDSTETSGAAILRSAHAEMRHTRGAAVAISLIDTQRNVVTYCGLGNIAGSILQQDGTSKSMVSQNGILGHEAKRFSEFEYEWNAGALLVMHSDGLLSQWSLDQYAGILQRDPALIAAILYRDYTRGRDDVTVAVLRM